MSTKILDAETQISQNHAGQRILVVDDEPINRELAKMQLEYVGLIADTASDGAKAVSMAKETNYAVILMDMQMPNIDGLAATRLIRQIPQQKNTPILAMTANVFAEDKALCLAAGMDDFLTKPIDLDLLYARLLEALEQNISSP